MRDRFHRQFVGAVVAFCAVFGAYAGTHITGNISDTQFEPGGNPYIVEQDIVVPAGKEVKIPAGCVFLFKQFTGITVEGRLTVDGSAESPVVFTSINDADYNPESENLPNTFDWNGITVARDAKPVVFRRVTVSYSVYGIRSNNKDIIVDACTFKQNGQYHLTVGGEIMPVAEKSPYSYNVKTAEPAVTTGSGGGTPVKPVDPHLQRLLIKNVAAIATGVAALGLGGGATYFGLTARKAGQDYDAQLASMAAAPDADKAGYLAKADAAYALYEKNRQRAIIVGVCAAVLAPVDVVLWVWQPKKPDAKVSIDVRPLGPSCALTVRF